MGKVFLWVWLSFISIISPVLLTCISLIWHWCYITITWPLLNTTPQHAKMNSLMCITHRLPCASSMIRLGTFSLFLRWHLLIPEERHFLFPANGLKFKKLQTYCCVLEVLHCICVTWKCYYIMNKLYYDQNFINSPTDALVSCLENQY
jgi:hypothetical protein